MLSWFVALLPTAIFLTYGWLKHHNILKGFAYLLYALSVACFCVHAVLILRVVNKYLHNINLLVTGIPLRIILCLIIVALLGGVCLTFGRILSLKADKHK